MSKVSKEFWVSDFDLEDVHKNLEGDISLSKNENKVFKNRVTISYEIDREVTIKESDLKNVLNKYLISEITVENIRDAIFGGGESE